MYDFIKAVARDVDVQSILNGPLEFKLFVDEKTAEVSPFYIARNHNLEFKLFETGTLIVKGSLHRLADYLEGTGNGANFTSVRMADIISSISHITFLTGIEASRLKISNLEFGINLPITRPAQYYLEKLILYKNYMASIVLCESSNDLFMAKFQAQQYEVKLYDKGWQFRLDKPLLRIELKITRMVYFKTVTKKLGGHLTLASLDSHALYYFLYNKLELVINYLLFLSTGILQKCGFPREDALLMSTRAYWRHQLMKKEAYKVNRQRLKRRLKKYSQADIRSELKLLAARESALPLR